jgi:hypothetical protein
MPLFVALDARQMLALPAQAVYPWGQVPWRQITLGRSVLFLPVQEGGGRSDACPALAGGWLQHALCAYTPGV